MVECGRRPRRTHPPISTMMRFVFVVGFADEGDAENRDAARAQRLDRQQTVVDRAERRSGAEHDRKPPARQKIEKRIAARQRHQQTAAPSITRGRSFGGTELSGSMRPVELGGADAATPASATDRPPEARAEAAKARSRARFRVRSFVQSRLDRLPVIPRARRQARPKRPSCRCRYPYL